MPSLPTCEQGQNIIVCYGARGIHRRTVIHCPICERRTPFVVTWDGAYYGQTVYCTVCLDVWECGERAPRPFQRYWRRDRAERIRRLWDTALMPDDYRKWTRRDMHRATCIADDACAECEATA